MHVLPVPLAEGVHAELDRIATETGRPAALVAQDAIVAWLEARRRTGLRVLPEAEIDPELEVASVELVIPPDDGQALPPKTRRRLKR